MKLLRVLLTSIKSSGSGPSFLAAPAPPMAPAPAPIREKLVRKLFGKYLLVTNTVSAGLLMVAGDLAAQEFEIRGSKKKHERQEGINWTRVGQMFIVGCLSGPPHHVFYKWLDRLIPKANTAAVLKKICMDQMIFSPICIFVFFYGAGIVEGRKLTECAEELKQKFWTVYKTDWSVWPAAQFINFYFLPTHYRVLYVNAVTTAYNIFLSHIKHKDMKAVKQEE